MQNEINVLLRRSYNANAIERENSEIQAWKLKPRENFLQLLLKENKISLLEIGAGTGKDSEFFAGHGLEVTATDLSENMVALCRQKGLHALILDFFHLNELERTFDAVWSMNSLLHVEKANLDFVLKQIDAVLNPKGLFHMGVYGGSDFEGYLEKDNYDPPRFFSFFSLDRLKTVLERHFEIVDFSVIDLGESYSFQSVIARKQPKRQESIDEVL